MTVDSTNDTLLARNCLFVFNRSYGRKIRSKSQQTLIFKYKSLQLFGAKPTQASYELGGPLQHPLAQFDSTLAHAIQHPRAYAPQAGGVVVVEATCWS